MTHKRLQTAHLRAPLSNGMTVLVRCEEITTLKKCFLRGIVKRSKYRVQVLEPVGVRSEVLYEAHCYEIHWWWRWQYDNAMMGAMTLHLKRLKKRLERSKLDKQARYQLSQ